MLMEEVQLSRKELDILYAHFLVSPNANTTFFFSLLPYCIKQEAHRKASFWGNTLQFSRIYGSQKTEPTIDKERFIETFCRLTPWKHMGKVAEKAAKDVPH